eukprot:1335057-Amorphochlora_amoeboformis.AAC.2
MTLHTPFLRRPRGSSFQTRVPLALALVLSLTCLHMALPGSGLGFRERSSIGGKAASRVVRVRANSGRELVVREFIWVSL